MGYVYKGWDPGFDRSVAIKTIVLDKLSQQQAADLEARFREEALAAGKLIHQRIVGVYDVGRDGDIAYLVMELVEGEDLGHQIKRGERFSLERVFSVLGDLLEALNYVHEQGIVHRDIKPGNMLIDAAGRVKLGDFGIARITGSRDKALTTIGIPIGTFRYMSPEQMRGDTVDGRTDLWAAGVVFYQMLTGERPFDGSGDAQVMYAVMQKTPPAPSSINPSIPPIVDAVVFKALEKEASRRYSSARDFMLALRNAVAEIAGERGPTARAAAPAPRPDHLPPPSPPKADTGPSNRTAGTNTSITQESEALFWRSIIDSTDAEDFENYLEQFPNGIYAALARRRLRKLGTASTTEGSSASHALERVVLDKEATQIGLSKPIAVTPATALHEPPAPLLADDSLINFGAPQASAPADRNIPSSGAKAGQAADQLARQQVERARRDQLERAAREKADLESVEQARMAALVAEKAHIEKQKAEQLRAQQEHIAAEKAEAERLARETAEKERLDQQRAAQQRAEQERIAIEDAEKERVEKQEADRQRAAQERAAAEGAEADRLAREKAEKERQERLNAAQQRAEQDRMEAEKARDRERAEKAEKDRLEKQQELQQRAEHERIAAEKVELARLALEKTAKERLQKLKTEQEVAERARIAAAQKAAGEQAARETAEKERLSRQKADQQRAERERVAAVQQAAEKQLEQDKAEHMRLASLKTAQDLAEQTRLFLADVSAHPSTAPATVETPTAAVIQNTAAFDPDRTIIGRPLQPAPSGDMGISSQETNQPSNRGKVFAGIGVGLFLAAVGGYFAIGHKNEPPSPVKNAPAPVVTAPVPPAPVPVSPETPKAAKPEPAILPPPPAPPRPTESATASKNASNEKTLADQKEKAATEKKQADAKAAEVKAAEDKKKADLKVTESKAAEDKRQADQKAADAKATEDKRQADLKAADLKAADAKAAEAKRQADQKAVEAKAAEDKRLTDVKAAETKAAEDKKQADLKAAEAKSAEEKRQADIKAADAKPKVKTPDEFYSDGEKAMQAGNVPAAKRAFALAGDKGHGPSQKRMWEIESKAGNPTEAVRWQRKAFDSNVQGVPEPAKAIILK